MPSHDPTYCRDQLATLMAESNTRLAALEALLTQEYEMLQTRDVEGLEQAGTARQQCIGHILRIEDERRALCRATGRGEDPAGLHSLLAWCDPTGLLLPAMQDFRERTQRCREQNDRNGMLVNARLQGVSRTLNVLDRGAQEGQTYGPGSDNTRRHGGVVVTRA